MVAGGGVYGCRDVHGCDGCAWLQGVCMVAGGACVVVGGRAWLRGVCGDRVGGGA